PVARLVAAQPQSADVEYDLRAVVGGHARRRYRVVTHDAESIEPRELAPGALCKLEHAPEQLAPVKGELPPRGIGRGEDERGGARRLEHLREHLEALAIDPPALNAHDRGLPEPGHRLVNRAAAHVRTRLHARGRQVRVEGEVRS